MTRPGAFLVSVGAALMMLVGCTPNPAPTVPPPTPEVSATSPTVAPSPSPSPWELPSRSATPIAVAEVRQGAISGRTGEVSDPSVSFLVHAACRGSMSMAYKVTVAGELATASTFRCGVDSVSSAFQGKTGLVQIELSQEGNSEGDVDGYAEVIAQP